MSVRPYQTTFHRFSQCCICRTDDNSVDLENDTRHDVPSLPEANQHEITCTYNYRTDSLRPEEGLLKGGPGPSCTRPHTENRQRKDHKQADSQDTSFSS